MHQVDYGIYADLADVPFEKAIDRVTAALKDQGFGILTTIDVRQTLKEKIDVDFRPYVILGACAPQLAHRALSTDDNIGLLLPCNVVVSAKNGGSEVSVAHPGAMVQLSGNEQLQPVAEEAERRLRLALEGL